MQKHTLYGLMASALLLAALLVNHAAPRLPITTLKLAPIAELPTTLGDWRRVRDLPIEDRVRVAVPNAVWLSRLYRDGQGNEAQLLLETSTDAQMFHAPTQCMPAQNWNIQRTRAVSVGTDPATRTTATEMQMDAEGQRALLLYWYTSERQLDKWEALKSKIVAGRAPTRLFVRVLTLGAGDFAAASDTARRLASAALPSLRELELRAR